MVRLTNDPAQYNPFDSNAIPNFQSLIITNGATLAANSWNGSAGGWIVIKVRGTMYINSDSSISASGLGYRGGGYTYSPPTFYFGVQGESYTGSQTASTSANGGGGGGGQYNGGGGGGGYGTSGEGGHDNANQEGSGGGTYGASSLSTVYLGSGGGGGDFFSSGGNGGGAIVLNAGILNAQGGIQAIGNPFGGNYGGAGSGGSILLNIASGYIGTNIVNASGGYGWIYAASGGVGRIAVDYAESFAGVTTPTAYTFNDTNSDTINITNQPTSQSIFLGSNVLFNVGFTTLSPFTLQWYFNGSPISGATNQNLSLFNLSLTNQGNYWLTISDVVMSVNSSNVYLTVLDTNMPFGDYIPNWWKTQYGLSLSNPTLATNYPPGDKLTYLEKYLYGLNPLTNDTDGDGLTDYDELFVYHTNPLLASTASDGIPDGWKVQNGINPLIADASNEAGFDGVTYMQIYQYDLAHTNQLNPNNPFAVGSGFSNYEIINNGQHTNKFYYDHEDRLLGMESSRGISIGYQYDGNGNLLRQSVLSRAAETNGLPVLWLWLNRLTNQPGIAYANSDSDGWNNYQEWLAGSNPNNSNSTPSLLGNPGINIASLTLPFTPSNFVVGVGQLDNINGQEIVVGADGNPGTSTNFLLVLSQTSAGWSTQRVDVGQFGVTSIAVGQVTNRPVPAIYAGLRGLTNGSGRVLEFTSNGGVWQSNQVALSTNQSAFVLGVRGQDLLVSLARTNAADGALYALGFSTNWQALLIDTNTSHRGLGTIGIVNTPTYLRLLDGGGIAIQPGGNGYVPGGPFQMGDSFVEGSADELPVHTVNVSPFYMDKYEVTVALWNIVHDWAGAHDYDLNGGSGRGTNFPVQMLTWYDAIKWCNARSEMEGLPVCYYTDSFQTNVYRAGMIDLSNACVNWRSGGYRLPTEAEYEKAARGGMISQRYPWGNSINGSQANYSGNGGPYSGQSSPVDYYNGNQMPSGTNMANGYGLYDMAGNVWQWCWDWYDASWYGKPGSTTTDCHGPDSYSSYTRVMRDGSYGGSATYMRCAARSRWNPSGATSSSLDLGFGFRCVRSSTLSPQNSIAEPSATHLTNWRGTSLTTGSARGNASNPATFFYSFVDDINGNNITDVGDSFVTAEYLLSGTNATLLTLFHQPIASVGVAQSYGLACANFLNTSNDVFFTGEPDGQVFAWTATGATNALQRQLFSPGYYGKAWHALAGVKTLSGGAGLAGLMVDPANPNTCNVIFWSPQNSLPQLPNITETAPSAAVLPSANPLGSNAVVSIRLWDNEGNPSTPFLQYQFLGSTNWQNATLTALDGTFYNLATRVTALPTGTNHTLAWNALADVGANVVTNVLLRARAQDFMLVGNWSLPTPFQLNTTIATNPNPTNSPVNFTVISAVQGGIQFNWQGGTNAWLYLQRSPTLAGTNAVWVNIWTGAPPTPISGSYTDFFGTNPMEFYRLKVVNP